MASKFDRFSGWTAGAHDKCLLKINKLKEQCDSYKAEIKSLKAEVKLLKRDNNLLVKGNIRLNYRRSYDI